MDLSVYLNEEKEIKAKSLDISVCEAPASLRVGDFQVSVVVGISHRNL